MSSFRKKRVGNRLSGGQRVNGSWREGNFSTFNFYASIQPVTGEELENTPELRRREGAIYKVYTDTKLNSLRNSENPDVIEYNGKEWEVIDGEDWDNDVLNNRKYFIGEITSK